MKRRTRTGFTLIEMLVVIAIVAILVSVIVPTVASATKKTSAATDAANLRSANEVMNIDLFNGIAPEEIFSEYQAPAAKFVKNSRMVAYYVHPAVFEIYYVSGEDYYSIDYLADYATYGKSDILTVCPHLDSENWYSIPTSSK